MSPEMECAPLSAFYGFWNTNCSLVHPDLLCQSEAQPLLQTSENKDSEMCQHRRNVGNNKM